MSPSEVRELIQTTTIALVIVIPVLGVTARFAFRSIADAVIRLREHSGAGESQQLLEERMCRLEGEVEQVMELRTSVEQLTEELRFHRSLALPAAESSAAPAGSSRV